MLLLFNSMSLDSDSLTSSLLSEILTEREEGLATKVI